MGVFNRVRRNGFRIFGGGDSAQPQDDRHRILFVSHEATRTGAPKIVLNLLRHFARNPQLSLHTILHNGGHLVDDFAAASETKCLNMPRKHSEDLSRRVHRILTRKHVPLPKVAICNSMETRFIARELANHRVPIVFLIHELPSSYTENDYKTVFEIADRIIFPIEAVKAETNRKISVPEHKSIVLSQGLLDPDFGRDIDRDQARSKLRRDLNIPADSHVVLGCGTLDLRKGIDHFVAIARETVRLERWQSDRPYHFVWVGDGPRWTHSTYHYVELDMKMSGIEERVHFVGEQKNVEPYFFGADSFLLPSRVDPLPCVIHEAMTAQLPIVTFDQSGGACEAVKDGAGIVVPYGDYQLAANMIRILNTQQHLADSIRQKSLERVQNNYCFEDYAQKVMKVAEQVSQLSLNDAKEQDYLPFAA